jgi:hypothetical protein
MDSNPTVKKFHLFFSIPKTHSAFNFAGEISLLTANRFMFAGTDKFGQLQISPITNEIYTIVTLFLSGLVKVSKLIIFIPSVSDLLYNLVRLHYVLIILGSKMNS